MGCQTCRFCFHVKERRKKNQRTCINHGSTPDIIEFKVLNDHSVDPYNSNYKGLWDRILLCFVFAHIKMPLARVMDNKTLSHNPPQLLLKGPWSLFSRFSALWRMCHWKITPNALLRQTPVSLVHQKEDCVYVCTPKKRWNFTHEWGSVLYCLCCYVWIDGVLDKFNFCNFPSITPLPAGTLT